MSGNTFSKVKQAYEYWEGLDPDHELKESAYDVVKATVVVHNETCDSEDEMSEDELGWLFGVE